MRGTIRTTTSRISAVALALALAFTFGLTPATAQVSGPDVGKVLDRLGLPATSLDGVSPLALDTVCEGNHCDLQYTTRSDEACRAVAVDVALRRRAEQLRSGGSARVVSRVRCSSGMFAVFQTSSGRAVMGHRDSSGNTAQREIPL
jgi:hypothetical protein